MASDTPRHRRRGRGADLAIKLVASRRVGLPGMPPSAISRTVGIENRDTRRGGAPWEIFRTSGLLEPMHALYARSADPPPQRTTAARICRTRPRDPHSLRVATPVASGSDGARQLRERPLARAAKRGSAPSMNLDRRRGTVGGRPWRSTGIGRSSSSGGCGAAGQGIGGARIKSVHSPSAPRRTEESPRDTAPPSDLRAQPIPRPAARRRHSSGSSSMGRRLRRSLARYSPASASSRRGRRS